MKKVLTWALVIFLVFFVASRPVSAALVVKHIGNGLLNVGNQFGAFFSNLAS